MKILFLKNVENVAKAGEIKEVADGYARNFIVPKGFGVVATSDVQKHYEAQVKAQAKKEAELEAKMKDIAKVIESQTVTIKGKMGTGNKLYGSVTNSDIAKELSKIVDFDIDKRKIEMDAIKEIGDYTATVKLHKNVTAKVKIKVIGGAA